MTARRLMSRCGILGEAFSRADLQNRARSLTWLEVVSSTLRATLHRAELWPPEIAGSRAWRGVRLFF